METIIFILWYSLCYELDNGSVTPLKIPAQLLTQIILKILHEHTILEFTTPLKLPSGPRQM